MEERYELSWGRVRAQKYSTDRPSEYLIRKRNLSDQISGTEAERNANHRCQTELEQLFNVNRTKRKCKQHDNWNMDHIDSKC